MALAKAGTDILELSLPAILKAISSASSLLLFNS
jgi:hypothetical protein